MRRSSNAGNFMIAERIVLAHMPRQAQGSVWVGVAGWALSALFLVASLTWGSPRAFAQASELEKGPAPPPAEVVAPEPAKPQWDPLRAHKDIEIGSYYLKTGNISAAVDRFQEAATLQPGLAEPFRLLGRAYEKRQDPQNAVTAYRKYLDLYRTAPDRKEILKQIEKLTNDTERHTERQPAKQTSG
jgi:tetratricopeptide (TPR) repeat protein